MAGIELARAPQIAERYVVVRGAVEDLADTYRAAGDELSAAADLIRTVELGASGSNNIHARLRAVDQAPFADHVLAGVRIVERAQPALRSADRAFFDLEASLGSGRQRAVDAVTELRRVALGFPGERRLAQVHADAQAWGAVPGGVGQPLHWAETTQPIHGFRVQHRLPDLALRQPGGELVGPADEYTSAARLAARSAYDQGNRLLTALQSVESVLG